MKAKKFIIESGVKPEEAVEAMLIAAKAAHIFIGQGTQEVLNALVLLLAEFIANQDEKHREDMVVLVTDAIRANIPFFVEAHEISKAGAA